MDSISELFRDKLKNIEINRVKLIKKKKRKIKNAR